MDYDRIRELQEKFEENPRRYFAPLANEYRKGGQHKRAIEICRTHLAQMPGHMSGQIVFGQALFESGEWDEARTVFGRALALDPENLIALRSLGDMSLQAGDTGQARQWYTRLLDADPKDTAVIALVAEIDATTEVSPSPPAEVASTIATPADSSAAESAAPEFPAPETQAQEEAAVREAVETESSESEAAAPEIEADSPYRDAETAGVEEPVGLERHYPTESESTADAGVEPPAFQESAEPMEGLKSSRQDEDNALEAKRKDEADALEWAPPPEAIEHEHAPSSTQPEPEEPEPTEPERAEPEPAESQPATAHEERAFSGASPEPFVNETMAQLYLQQGYRQLALKVYRQLSASRPHDQSLRDRIADIEAADAAEHPDEVVAVRKEEPSIGKPSETAPPSVPPSRERESIEAPAREEPRAEPEAIAARQPSIREFFATLGRRRPPRPTAGSGMRSGNNVASETPVSLGVSPPGASLDAVFAGATVSPSDARAASRLAGAFSGATGTSRTPPTPPMPTPRMNQRLPQTQESEEDVAKFRAWLDGLTRE